MGSSARKKKEKKQDFQKAKLKVGKARPKNTNATDTSFSAKSIILKQQNLSEGGRDAAALFNHNLSLLSSKNETQRRDALTWLTTAVAATSSLPQPASVVMSKAAPLILDGNSQVRHQLLKLFKALPRSQAASFERALLHTRAGLTHLSTDIRLSSLDLLDWLLETNGEVVVSMAGSWIKILQTFQNLLGWTSATPTSGSEKWSGKRPSTNLGSNKLLVHQLTTLSRFMSAGLSQNIFDSQAQDRRIAALFPLWHTDIHLLPAKSSVFSYLNLFGAPRDIEGEVYDNFEERSSVFVELGMHSAFANGVAEAKREGGEVGRAAAMVDKALLLVDVAQ